jgi:isochorismate synthase
VSIEQLAKYFRKGTSFACYRLPDEQPVTVVICDSDPLVLSSCESLNGVEGFVIAPFSISSASPLVVIRPEECHTLKLENVEPATSYSYVEHSDPAQYRLDFERMHRHLLQGEVSKIVLSRQCELQVDSQIDAGTLFSRAVRLYPHLFVALISTPMTGTWLMATPEALLRGRNGQWQTMALAGTVSASVASKPKLVKWSAKNIKEQAYVTNYISHCLQEHSTQLSQHGPYTTQAAGLYHLRTDFNFQLRNPQRLGDFLNVLHPTPAVCGIPKETARQIIMEEESGQRRYYSGFCGWMGSTETNLFVSLRCMQLEKSSCRLYAGGGLLKQSEDESEWRETEAKMLTMKRLLHS